MFGEMYAQAGIVAKLTLLVAVVPMVMGVVYAIRPTESRLALMRPLSLASIFAGLCGMLAGFINMSRLISASAAGAVTFNHGAAGFSESLVPLFVAFGCLTVAWLCVALGMTRDSAHT
jgi:hypothetical protein